MDAWEIIKAAGIPALLLGLIVTSFVQVRAVKKGIQALLRDRLVQGYKFYAHQGYADVNDRSNMENVYIQYHALGANGVMDDLRKKFLALPLEDPHQPAPQTQAAAQPVNQSAAPVTTSTN